MKAELSSVKEYILALADDVREKAIANDRYYSGDSAPALVQNLTHVAVLVGEGMPDINDMTDGENNKYLQMAAKVFWRNHKDEVKRIRAVHGTHFR